LARQGKGDKARQGKGGKARKMCQGEDGKRQQGKRVMESSASQDKGDSKETCRRQGKGNVRDGR
jgi:hypothetical protein